VFDGKYKFKNLKEFLYFQQVRIGRKTGERGKIVKGAQVNRMG